MVKNIYLYVFIWFKISKNFYKYIFLLRIYIYKRVCGRGGGGVQGLRNTRMRINLPNPDPEG